LKVTSKETSSERLIQSKRALNSPDKAKRN
jgi:hypothetical protein